MYFQASADLIICNLHVSSECSMFIQYMNVIKCYYGNSNDCQIIIRALRIDGS